MTHCGWGGCLEFIGAGVPAVTFPHFADQPVNSELFVENKAGILLHWKRRTAFDFESAATYKDPAFDHKKIHEVFTKILRDPQYKQNMKRLQVQARMTNGPAKVVSNVEEVYFAGKDHLLDPEFKR